MLASSVVSATTAWPWMRFQATPSAAVVGGHFERSHLESFIKTPQQVERGDRVLRTTPGKFEDVFGLVGPRATPLLLKPGAKLHRPQHGGHLVQHAPRRFTCQDQHGAMLTRKLDLHPLQDP